MTLRGLSLVFLAAILTVTGNLMMRGGVVRSGGLKLAAQSVIPQLLRMGRDPLFVGGVIFYGVSAVVWFSIISTEQLSTAYPVLVSMTFLLVTAGSVFFYQENLSFGKLMGIALILL